MVPAPRVPDGLTVTPSPFWKQAGTEAPRISYRINGVADLIWLSAKEARALETALVVERALLSPSTGIIDSHGFMPALRCDAEAQGTVIAFETPVLAGRAVLRLSRRDMSRHSPDAASDDRFW